MSCGPSVFKSCAGKEKSFFVFHLDHLKCVEVGFLCGCVCIQVTGAVPLLARSTCSRSSANLSTSGNSSSHTPARKWSNVVFWSADFVSFSCCKTHASIKTCIYAALYSVSWYPINKWDSIDWAVKPLWLGTGWEDISDQEEAHFGSHLTHPPTPTYVRQCWMSILSGCMDADVDSCNEIFNEIIVCSTERKLPEQQRNKQGGAAWILLMRYMICFLEELNRLCHKIKTKNSEDWTMTLSRCEFFSEAVCNVNADNCCLHQLQ